MTEIIFPSPILKSLAESGTGEFGVNFRQDFKCIGSKVSWPVHSV